MQSSKCSSASSSKKVACRAALSLSLTLLLLASSSKTLTSAHSWLDCTNTLDDGTCAGFPRGYPSRSDIDINTKYTYLIQDRRPDASVCQPGRQNIPGNNPFPPASVTPGQKLHLTWQPDGHLDDSRPSTVEIHWTKDPTKQLHTRSELNDGTLLGTMIFATTGNCDQAWEPNTWCHGHITIPQDTQPGTYQMVWWWKYDRNPHGEEYSTCFEIVVGEGNAQIQAREVEPAGPQKLEMAKMVSPDPVPAVATVETDTVRPAGGEASAQDTTAPEAEKPHRVAPVYSMDQDRGQNLMNGKDYQSDETGALAGDAINLHEDQDTTPVPVISPSQLIHTTLDSAASSAATAPQSESKAGTSNNSNPTLNQAAVLGNATIVDRQAADNATAGPPSPLRPQDGSEHNVSSLPGAHNSNKTLVGQFPLDNGASNSVQLLRGDSTFSGLWAAGLAGLMATMTFMMV